MVAHVCRLFAVCLPVILLHMNVCNCTYHFGGSRPLPIVSKRPDLSHVFNYPNNLLQMPGGQRSCPAKSGSTTCKPAVMCSPWFAEMLQNPHWCWANGSYGACCPDVIYSTASVARFPEFSKLIALPRDLSSLEMEQIVQVARKYIEEISAHERNIWEGLLIPYWENSAPFSYSATTHALQRAKIEGWKGLQMVEASRKIAKLLNLDPSEAGYALQQLDVRDTALESVCRPLPHCDHLEHRSYDGSCNNLAHPNWGRSNSALERILPPQYSDGIWSPRDWPGLPPVDGVSSLIEDMNFPDHQLTVTVTHWGQFIGHDVSHVPTYASLNNTDIRCCSADGKYLRPEETHPLCFPIDVSVHNPFYRKYGVTCHHFVRSVAAARDDCKFGFANPLNQNTAYLDGSAIYGSTEDVADSLREGRGGRLRATVINGDYVLLPIDPKRQDCISDERGRTDCFTAGDRRVNQYAGLTVMHTVWLRLHNQYARKLSLMNPKWDDEKIYQETKSIIVALIQHITYNEYLPTVLGSKLMEDYGLIPLTAGYVQTYDPQVNAQVTTEFSSAAFRYGHSLVNNWNELWIDDTYSVYGGELHLKDWFNNPKILQDPLIFNAIIRSFITETSQNFDEYMADAIHRLLFKSPSKDYGMDLMAMNMRRGRGHGIRGYNHYLEACGGKRAVFFKDFLTVLRPEAVEKYKQVYSSVDDVDLYAGILAEWPIEGGIVGPVTSCIIADQFSRLKDGDRFFYENGGLVNSFTVAQLDSIRKMSLARVLCDIADTVDWITPNVFWTPSPSNPWLPCSGEDIPQIDLNLWKSL